MTLPPITFEEALEMRLPGEYVPEFDADLLIATYQRSRDTLDTLVPRAFTEKQLLDAIKAQHTPPELDAALVMRAYETAQVLRAMRDETPKLPTLTIVDVLYDIVRAIRNRD